MAAEEQQLTLIGTTTGKTLCPDAVCSAVPDDGDDDVDGGPGDGHLALSQLYHSHQPTITVATKP